MALSKESHEACTPSDEEVLRWYRFVKKDFSRYGYELHMSEAAYLRSTIRKLLQEYLESAKAIANGHGNLDGMKTYQEIYLRFFWYFYGVDWYSVTNENKQNTILFLQQIREKQEFRVY